MPTWKDLQERDPIFFFEVWKATFLVAITPLNKMLFELENLDFWERDERLRCPTNRAKICDHKNCDTWNLFCISKNLSKSLILLQNNKSNVL